MSPRRALHYVFKIGNRKETVKFYTQVLGMKVLRHEEFEEGCKATCNGPYDGKWSKTMIGYGAEDKHFVIELTYNYGIKSYKLGNDFIGITINSNDVVNNAKKVSWPMKTENGLICLEAPGGYKYFIDESKQVEQKDPVNKVAIACSNLVDSAGYWGCLLGMKTYAKTEKSAVLGYSDDQCKLEIKLIGESIDRGEAFGRIAFSCPAQELPQIEALFKNAGRKVVTPLVKLDTPGKATVEVVILADPNDHEICFVGDEAFRTLSEVDPNAQKLLMDAIAEDKSDEWFAKKTKAL